MDGQCSITDFTAVAWRTFLQTAYIARRLMRGSELHREAQAGWATWDRRFDSHFSVQVSLQSHRGRAAMKKTVTLAIATLFYEIAWAGAVIAPP